MAGTINKPKSMSKTHIIFLIFLTGSSNPPNINIKY